jgi:hypothetical protein
MRWMMARGAVAAQHRSRWWHDRGKTFEEIDVQALAGSALPKHLLPAP